MKGQMKDDSFTLYIAIHRLLKQKMKGKLVLK